MSSISRKLGLTLVSALVGGPQQLTVTATLSTQPSQP